MNTTQGNEKNPYREDSDKDQVQSGMDLFGSFRLIPSKKKQSERGLLLEEFSKKLGKPIGFVAMKLAKLSVQDLYFIRSDCNQAEARGIPWGAAFYSSLKPKE